MFERLQRRMEALQKQIDAEKEAKGKPQDGLTVPTAVERYHAVQQEKRQIADFEDTAPGGAAPCLPATQPSHPLFYGRPGQWDKVAPTTGAAIKARYEAACDAAQAAHDNARRAFGLELLDVQIAVMRRRDELLFGTSFVRYTQSADGSMTVERIDPRRIILDSDGSDA